VQHCRATSNPSGSNTPLPLQVIDAAQFPTFDAYAAEVQRVWDAKWEEVLGPDPAGDKGGLTH
jgi:hypothetical protein